MRLGSKSPTLCIASCKVSPISLINIYQRFVVCLPTNQLHSQYVIRAMYCSHLIQIVLPQGRKDIKISYTLHQGHTA
jgi:hypothetical protein